jgi:precorrin-6Y C5,15-methyltransferase (decarboxylating)
MSNLHLIGIDGRPWHPNAQAALDQATAVFTTERFRPWLNGFPGEVLAITPLQQAVAQMATRLEQGPIAVLASGDPLFFGIGRTLIQRFGQAQVVIHPALSAMQLAFARLREPWQDAHFVSLHGRQHHDLLATVLRHPKLFLFTDPVHRPETIATELGQGLADLGLTDHDCRIMVAEDLGMVSERLTHGSPQEIAGQHFSDLNCMIIRLAPACATLGSEMAPGFRLGLTTAEISHSRGLITKDEVRAAILHHLRLPEQGVLWDIGAGSGSVACEAARLCPGLTVFAIERHAEQQAHILANRRALRLANLHLVPGQAPAPLAGLPDPDRVFIGGSGGQLAPIVQMVYQRLPAGGILMASAVTDATREAAPAIFLHHGLRVTLTTIAVTRESYPPSPQGAIHLNPITLITGTK